MLLHGYQLYEMACGDVILYRHHMPSCTTDACGDVITSPHAKLMHVVMNITTCMPSLQLMHVVML